VCVRVCVLGIERKNVCVQMCEYVYGHVCASVFVRVFACVCMRTLMLQLEIKQTRHPWNFKNKNETKLEHSRQQNKMQSQIRYEV